MPRGDAATTTTTTTHNNNTNNINSTIIISITNGAQHHTSEITTVEIQWKMPPKVHGTIPTTYPGEVTTLWKVPLTSEDPLDNATEHEIHWKTPLQKSVYIYIYIYTHIRICIYVTQLRHT